MIKLKNQILLLKSIIIIAILIFQQASIIAQFISENIEWKARYPIYNTLIGELEEQTTRTYFFEGDTIIGSQNYKKLNYFEDSIRLLETPVVYFSAFRSEDKRIYENLDSDNERLLYDFGMQLKDTIERGYDDVFTPYYLVVSQVDSIELKGKTKMKYIISHGEIYDADTSEYYYSTIIEDYGNIDRAPFYPWCLYTNNYNCNHELLCIYEDQELIYKNPNSEYCFIDISLSSKELKLNSYIKLFPNPVNSNLTIEIEKLRGDYNCTITDLTGKKVITKLLESKSNSLDFGALNLGVYFIKITSKEKYFVSKIIKE